MKDKPSFLFGQLKPNAPGKALFWINSILLLTSLYLRVLIFYNVLIFVASVIGIITSILLWYAEIMYLPLPKVSVTSVWQDFNDRVTTILAVYALVLFIWIMTWYLFLRDFA